MLRSADKMCVLAAVVLVGWGASISYAEMHDVVRQQFSWDADAGLFVTSSLEVVGQVGDPTASVEDILRRPAMGAIEQGYRKLGLPVRYTCCDPATGDYFSVPTSATEWPSAVRYLPPTSSLGVDVRAEAVIAKYDNVYTGLNPRGESVPTGFEPVTEVQLANGWNIRVTETYGVSGPNPDPMWGWGNEIRITAPSGETSYVYGDPHLLQAGGTQQQELAAVGTYVFDLGGYTLNLYCEQTNAGFSLLTDFELSGPNGYSMTVGRNAEAKVKGGTDFTLSGGRMISEAVAYYVDPTDATSPACIADYVQGSGVLTVDFGDVILGEQKELAAYIFNAGDFVLDAIGGEGPDGPQFTLLDDAYQLVGLGLDEFVPIDLCFAPDKLGEFSDQITTDIGFTINLVGACVPVPEPTTLALLALGGLSLARRRRRS